MAEEDSSPLILPDGVKFARVNELPGSSEDDNLDAKARIVSATILTGFTITRSDAPGFSYYAEVNVNAPQIWSVFDELCRNLLEPESTLLVGEVGDEPADVGSADTEKLLKLLEPLEYQLVHDGYFQFGLLSKNGELIREVFLTPTKHFRIWFEDKTAFRVIMWRFGIPEADDLEFLYEYPHTTTRSRDPRIRFREFAELADYLAGAIEEGR